MSISTKPNIAADLIRFHKLITRSLNVSIEQCRQFIDQGLTDDKLRIGFASYLQALSAVLHAHHLVEDDLAFPYIRELFPDMPIDDLITEHQQIESLVSQIHRAAQIISKGEQTSQSMESLYQTLVSVNALWHPHIQKEEEHFTIEKADLMIPMEEHIRLGKEFAAYSQLHAGPPYLVTPFTLYNLEAQDRAVFLARMPEEVTQRLLPVDWYDQWAPMKPFLLE